MQVACLTYTPCFTRDGETVTSTTDRRRPTSGACVTWQSTIKHQGFPGAEKLPLCDDEMRPRRFLATHAALVALGRQGRRANTVYYQQSESVNHPCGQSQEKQQAAVQAAQTACRIATMVRSRPDAYPGQRHSRRLLMRPPNCGIWPSGLHRSEAQRPATCPSNGRKSKAYRDMCGVSGAAHASSVRIAGSSTVSFRMSLINRVMSILRLPSAAVGRTAWTKALQGDHSRASTDV